MRGYAYTAGGKIIAKRELAGGSGVIDEPVPKRKRGQSVLGN